MEVNAKLLAALQAIYLQFQANAYYDECDKKVLEQVRIAIAEAEAKAT